MPYFAWRGIQLDGSLATGSLFVPSVEMLDALLFKKGIALLHVRRKPLYRFLYPVLPTAIIGVFEQMQVLSAAGIRLAQLLLILAEQQPNPRLQEMLFFAAGKVNQGELLYAALAQYPRFFDAVVLHQLQVAESVGRIPEAARLIQQYLERKAAFRTQMRSLLAMPAITAFFLVAVIMIIFGSIMPQFASIFIALGQDLPPLTHKMIALSHFMHSFYFPAVIGIGVLLMSALVVLTRSGKGKVAKDVIVLKLPIFADLVRYHTVAQCYLSLALLLEEGVPLDRALVVVQSMMINTVFSAAFICVHQRVDEGIGLAQSLAFYPHLFPADGIAVITVGQEASALPVMLRAVAGDYQKKLDERMSRLVMLAQPCLLLILGLLIGLVIIAVYTPIMQVAYKI